MTPQIQRKHWDRAPGAAGETSPPCLARAGIRRAPWGNSTCGRDLLHPGVQLPPGQAQPWLRPPRAGPQSSRGAHSRPGPAAAEGRGELRAAGRGARSSCVHAAPWGQAGLATGSKARAQAVAQGPGRDTGWHQPEALPVGASACQASRAGLPDSQRSPFLRRKRKTASPAAAAPGLLLRSSCPTCQQQGWPPPRSAVTPWEPGLGNCLSGTQWRESMHGGRRDAVPGVPGWKLRRGKTRGTTHGASARSQAAAPFPRWLSSTCQGLWERRAKVLGRQGCVQGDAAAAGCMGAGEGKQ